MRRDGRWQTVARVLLATLLLYLLFGVVLGMGGDRGAGEQFVRDAFHPVADALVRPTSLRECRGDPANLPPQTGRDGRPARSYHTCGRSITDGEGMPLHIVGVNWFGLETDTYAPDGLWTRNWGQLLDQVALLGFNTIRLPFSNEALVPGRMPTSINYALNPDLEGKTSLEVMDAIVDGAGKRGLKVILDRHRPTPEGQSELWYTEAVPEERWIADWVMLAGHYRGQEAVIGADLHNEPRGAATWGSGDPATDWRPAAERAGNAVLEANPYLLIFVQGIERHGDDWYWWGGNLQGVQDAPVRLNLPGRVVYAPHEYGPGIYPQSWFQAADFPQNLPLVWGAHWGYVAQDAVAPVVLGEFGARDPSRGPDAQWQQALMSYVRAHGVGWIAWSLNPNSADTGGLLAEDWHTVVEYKAQLYRAQAAPFVDASGSEGHPVSTSRLLVRTRNSTADEQISTLSFVVQVVNNGSEPISFRDLTLRYWFTPELLDDQTVKQTQEAVVDFAAMGTKSVKAEIEAVPGPDGSSAVKLTFSDDAGTLQPFTASGDIQIRVHKSDWSLYQQSNDFSFKPGGAMGDWDRVTLYRDGQRAWGKEAQDRAGTAPEYPS